ncbi:SAV_915 family protein [Streptosporangium sp. NPDC002544]|uniref:SAV_915 family protein n=1 Tax=Streptosporangium sp. NPDC002544 TaxID=3154538 RepID=UPI0033224A05
MSEVPLFVPIWQGRFSVSLRLFRTAAGRKTAVAFSSALCLADVLGTEQQWMWLSEPALRGMIRDLDVIGIVIDPAGTMIPSVAGAA